MRSRSTIRETSRRGHATELARAAADEGFDVVVVFAGDGTLNEAADGLAGTPVALAPLPEARPTCSPAPWASRSIPLDAAGPLVGSLAAGSFRRVGLGAATAPGHERRRFLFHLGLGFDAAIIRRMEQRSYLKRHFAHPAFVVATVDTWLRHYDRRSEITLAITGPGGVAHRRRPVRGDLEFGSLHVPGAAADDDRPRRIALSPARGHRPRERAGQPDGPGHEFGGRQRRLRRDRARGSPRSRTSPA